jgi:hypothetical protein
MIPLRRCGVHGIRLRLGKDPNFYSPYPLHIVDMNAARELYETSKMTTPTFKWWSMLQDCKPPR